MKKILFFIVLLRVILITMIMGCAVIASAQQSVAINTDGTIADNSALLDIKSNSKGILIPRLTTAQKTAIFRLLPVCLYIKQMAQQVFIIIMVVRGLHLVLPRAHSPGGQQQEMVVRTLLLISLEL